MTLTPGQASPQRQQRALPLPGGGLRSALTGDAGGTATAARAGRHLR